MSTEVIAEPVQSFCPSAEPQKVTSTEIEMALLEAQKKIKGVGKASYNDHFKFSYASSDQLLTAAREALHSVGVSFRMNGFTVWDKTPSIPHMKWARCEFVLVHGPSMQAMTAHYDWPICGDKKPFDKMLGGALTTATRYYLRGLLSIPQIDGNEEMAARQDPGDSHQGGEDNQGQIRWATRDQFHQIGALIRETNAVPASIEASFGPSDELTIETANQVIDYLKKLKEKGAAK